MAKRFECPRCGAGVKPDDAQCFRCGESLRPEDPNDIKKAVEIASVAIDKVVADDRAGIRTNSLEYQSITRLKAILEEKERELAEREKEVETRESALAATADSLEQDTKALEDALRRYEAEQAEIGAREGALREREAELDALGDKVEGAEGRPTKQTIKARQSLERSEDLKDDGLRQVAEDKARLLEQLDKEISERKGKLVRMQEQMRKGKPSRKHKPTPEERTQAFMESLDAPKVDQLQVAKAVAVLQEELASQIGSGFSGTPEHLMSTGDERLDSIFGGGIPDGHVVIVNGAPGTMKSALAYYMVHNATLGQGRRGMYFSLEQRRDSIIRQMERMSMPHSQVEDKMMVVDMVDLRKSMADREEDWRTVLMRYVKNVHAERKFDVFVLDSLESFKSMADFAFDRESMKELFDWFKELGITVIVITEKSIDALLESAHGETYLADGVVELSMKEFADAKVYRWIRCFKMRAMNNDSRYYAFYHDGKSFRFALPLVQSAL
jgi:KaiC/GvpD/RAD55 family RecA-like ATPase